MNKAKDFMVKMGVDLQLQIYILACVFGIIFILMVFFLAGICGQISKIKRKLHFDHIGQHSGYDNYAYASRTIQPDEELSRRGFTMYDPNNMNNRNSNNSRVPNVHRNNGNYSKNLDAVRQQNAAEIIENEGSHDIANEYSIANSETVVMSGNETEMKIMSNYRDRKSNVKETNNKNMYPPIHGIPPPPAFASTEPSASNIRLEHSN